MVNLIIGGGSFKGISYVGSLEYLYKNNLLTNLKKFFGSSVGSIIGILYCTGYKPVEILNILLSVNFKDFWDFNLNNIETKYSIITDTLFIKIKEIYSHKENSKITFKQFYNKYNIDLNIYATSLQLRQNICFNKDTYPDLEIFTAVQASSSIPFIFPPVKINGEYFIDGCMKCIDGVCSNIINNHENSINYIIKGDYKFKEINSLIDYFSEILNCTMQNECEINNDYTINISLNDKYNNKYNFNDINNSLKLELYYEGLIQAKKKINPLLEKEKLEKEKLEKDQTEKEKLEKEKLEKEKLEKEKLEKEKLEKEKLEKEKLEKEKLEKEKLEKEKLEKEKLEKDQTEKEKLEKEKLEKDQTEKEKLEKDQTEKEKLEKDQTEKEKLEKDFFLKI